MAASFALARTLFWAGAVSLALLQHSKAQPAYVGSAACVDCHPAEAAAWEGSHHALAWADATPANMLADFDGTTFAHDGATYR
ncbi:multiheme c-type cytochrome, partial [Rubrimonas sp.]|uniref:multiheme c-type cytochrome n=1 Tax=Rubrimonas sp. TaxID=2036015 RepID=UPI002FDCE21C